jgi:hypothetical protein
LLGVGVPGCLLGFKTKVENMFITIKAILGTEIFSEINKLKTKIHN